MRKWTCIVFCLAGVTLAGGCGGYATPGGVADFASVADARRSQSEEGVSDTLRLMPLAQLPTAIAVVRVQGPAYASFGPGDRVSRFAVVNTRDVEKPEVLAHLGALPMVNGIVPISSIRLPGYPTASDLRRAGAELHADMLLMYSLSTTSHITDKFLPLTVVTLGLSPNEVVEAHCTASAVLIDTRNGYVYATVEGIDRADQLASAWTSQSALEYARTKSEQGAFDNLTAQIPATWQGVIKQLQSPKSGFGLSQ